MQKFNDNIYKNQRNEKQIMSNWRGNINNPKVTIICITYNHEKYINDAINSFLMQDTDFEFEILIHDDASTDNTSNIIREYEKKYPNIIKPIYQKENQFSKKMGFILDMVYPKVKGKYIALCEGDDYWTDPKKLQKQVDFLEKEPDFKLIFHKSIKLSYETQKNEIIGEYSKKTINIPFENIILRTKGMIPTSSCVISKDAFYMTYQFILDNKYLTQGDIYMQYISAFNKGALYIDEIMSVYRYRTNESWTKKYYTDSDFKTNVLFYKLKSFVALKKFMNIEDSILSSIFINYLFQLRLHLFKINSKDLKQIDLICKDLVLKTLIDYNLLNSSVILFSASSNTKWIIEEFKNILNIQYILDSDISKHNKLFYNYRIKHFSNVNIDLPILFTLFGREYELSYIKENILDYNVILVKEKEIEQIYTKIQKILLL